MLVDSEKMMAGGSGSPMEEEVHLHDYLNVLLRRRRLVMVMFLGVFFTVALATLLATPIYEASATLHVKEGNASQINPLAALGLNDGNSVETEIEILKSRTNVEQVVQRLQLDWPDLTSSSLLKLRITDFTTAYPQREFSVTKTGENSYRVSESERVIGDGVVGKRFEHEALTLWIDRIDGPIGEKANLQLSWFNAYVQGIRTGIRATEVGKRTGIIQVSYQADDPILARDVINTLTEVYLERGVAFKAEEAGKSVSFIEKQLDEVRKQLDSAEQGVQDYRRDNGLVRLDVAAENLIARMSQIEQERAALILRQRQAEFAIEGLQTALRKGRSYAPAALMDDPVLAALAKGVADMEVERQGLMIDRSAAHPQIRMLNDRITEAEQKMLATYQSHRETLKDRIVAVDQQLRADEAELRRLPAAEQELARRARLAQVSSDIYTFLLQKHEEARIARAATSSSIDVIDPAIVPVNPVRPRTGKNLLLGLVVGLMCGVGAAFFAEYMDDTIQDVDKAKTLLGLPLLGIIPQAITTADAEAQEPPALICVSHGRSPVAEAFRALRTNLRFSAAEQKKILLVTSTFPSEGKSTITSNLALTLAQTGSRILLVGCDLRRPSLCRHFIDENKPGLSEYLIGDASMAEIIRTTRFDNLEIVPSGTIPPNPAELLASGAMRTFLDGVRERYDFILLDAPPLFVVADAAILSPLSEMVLLVMEIGRFPTRDAQRLREALTHLRAPLGGMILNDKSGKGESYYGRSFYSRYEMEEIPPTRLARLTERLRRWLS